jgi:retinol dehydrogenase-12
MGNQMTEDGFEMHMGINYLGHYLLARLLVPMLKSTAKSGGKVDVRIVMTSSLMQHYSQGPIRLQDIDSLCPVKGRTLLKINSTID